MESNALLIVSNLLLALFGGWLCICRMAKMRGSTTKGVIRLQYMMWFAGFAADGGSWLYYQPANIPQLLMTIIIVATLLMGVDAWRERVPDYAMKQ